MTWKDLSYNEKVSLRNSVSTACFRHNLQWLKEALPTVQDLVEYEDTHNGGGFLHTLMYAYDTNEKSSSVSMSADRNQVTDMPKPEKNSAKQRRSSLISKAPVFIRTTKTLIMVSMTEKQIYGIKSLNRRVFSDSLLFSLSPMKAAERTKKRGT